MKKIVTLLILFIGFTTFSQSREQILDELSELLKSQGSPSELFYVESEEFLDINEYQVKLNYTELRYEESNGPMLAFNCNSGVQCIYDPKTKKSLSTFAIPMKDKEEVYNAIELINKIPDARVEVRSDSLANRHFGVNEVVFKGNYWVGNRKALNKPSPKYDCNEEGRIIVSISVDQSGRVVSAEPGINGTTNSAQCLLNSAKEAALKTIFNADGKAPSNQIGVIIYNFSLSE